MKIVWNDQSIRWFQNAAEYTGYNRALARLLLDYLPKGGTLCDMGCGTALTDFELAPYFQEITCVDISRKALAAVESEAQRRGITNITTLLSDGRKAEGSWDAVMALFHGGSDKVDAYLEKARDTLIFVTHASRVGTFSSEEHKVAKRYNVSNIQRHLEERELRFTVHEASLEYGQPLTDLEDARAFVKAYTNPMTEEETERYLSERLQTTGREDYPYYLYHRRKLGIFVIRKSENGGLWPETSNLTD